MKKIITTTILSILLCSGGCLFSQEVDSLTLRAIKSIDLYRGLIESPNPELAFQNLKELAELENPMAMNALGKAYMEALGCPADTALSFYWFKKAADAGYHSAWHNLGTIYKYGIYGIQDFTLAFYYFDKLANETTENSVLGLYDAGYMLYKGLGCKQDYVKARDYLEKASNKGYAPAMYLLALCYRNGYGTDRKQGEAGYWLSKSKKSGYTPAIEEYYAEGPENTQDRVVLRSAGLRNIPKEYVRNVPHIKKKEVKQLDGEYDGVLVTYDWSGKNVIKETHLSLIIKTEKDRIWAEWREEGADTLQVEATWRDSCLVFSNAYQYRQGHYDANGKVIWNFTNARLQLLNSDTSSYIVGNISMFSPEVMEPNQPMYISLRKNDVTLEDSKKDNSFIVYPNPFKEGINISFYQSLESDVKVAIYETTGKLVQFESLGKFGVGQQQIALSTQIPSGTYVLKLFANQKEYSTVIIRK